MTESAYVDHASLTDAALLQRYVGLGDAIALATVVNRHHAVVFAVCRQLLGSTHDADDAYQTVFLVLVRNARKIRKPDSLSSWLYGVAYRVAMRIRTQRAKLNHELSNHAAPHLATTSDLDPLVKLARQDQRTAAHDAIAALPESLRRPLVLRYLAGKSNREVADELSMTVAAVEGRLKRAKSRLRVRLARRGLMLSAALLAIDIATSDCAVASEQMVTQLIEKTIQRCQRCGNSQSNSIAETDDATLTQIAQQEASKMIRNQLTRYALGLAACGVIGIATVAPRFAQRSHAQEPTSQQRDATVVVTPSAPSSQTRATLAPAVVTTTTFAFAGGQPNAAQDAREIAREKIRAALKQPTKLDFFDEPLKDALAYIANLHKIQIVIDRPRLDEEGHTSDDPVNLQVNDVTLQSGMNLMLRDLGLTHMYRDEVLVVTTEAAKQTELETRVYSFDETWPMTADAIVESIRQHVSPDSWDQVGGQGAMNAFSSGAIISQTYDAHEQIEDLLVQLGTQFAKSTPARSNAPATGRRER